MPEEILMLNSGIQTVVPQLATPQYVFLDFDGAVTSYHNRDLDIDLDNIEVEDSGFDAETISLIVSTLNEQFDDDIIFTADLPQTDEYSTVYIGTTPAFDAYGSFLGLAETIDIGNQIHDDNAFVFLNSTASLDTVVYAIAHETEHIVYGMEHGGDGIGRYAADIYVENGAVSNGLTISDLTIMHISSGGTANGTTVNSGGYLYVSSGGTATDIVENGGYVAIGKGATANFVANVIDNLPLSGQMTVHSGTTATGTAMNGGSMYVSSGGTANGTTVNSGASMHISSCGTANATTVNSGGYMRVYSGGTATDVMENGGYVYVADGAVVNFVANIINDMTVSYGGMTVHSGTTANRTMANGGWMEVSSGGTTSQTTVSSGGFMRVYGGTASQTTVNHGSMHVSSGGTANSTTVNGSGYLYVSSGGTANQTTVNGGKMYVSNGGVISGSLQIASGAIVSAYAGAVIDFTAAEQENPEVALVDRYDYISGRNEATYTITVSETLAPGKYALAGHAGDFNSNVSVKMADGQTIGYITGWRDLEANGRTYSLSITPDATLQLTIAGEIKDTTAPTITGIQANVTTFTNGNVQVSAVFADETELAQSLYRLGSGDLLAYSGPVTMTDNGTVHFRAVDASGNVAEAQYEVANIDKEMPAAVSGLAAVVNDNSVAFSWSPTTDNLSGVADYEIEVSDKSDFSHLVASSSGAGLTNYEMRISASGTYYYRVRATDTAGNASPWTTNQVDYECVPMAKLLVGTTGDDVFNMVPYGTWGTFHVARWNGETEVVSLARRNRFHDALEGVGGYDVVVLPDGDNALLYHDLLSPSAPGADASARLSGISDIRGNSGSDVIDLTAASGCYAGDLLLCGCAGDDHLWAGDGDDVLIGGTGNDDLRGGAGNDLYLFGLEWGQDKVVDDGGTLVFDSALRGKLAVSATDSGTCISAGQNTVAVNWQVEAGDWVFADVGELEGYRLDAIKAFLA